MSERQRLSRIRVWLCLFVAFAGPIRDPVRNKWVIQFGMIACVLVIPLAAICGPLRGIPLFWMPIDMTFGIAGIVPLILAYRHVRVLEASSARSGGDGALPPSPLADHPGTRPASPGQAS